MLPGRACQLVPDYGVASGATPGARSWPRVRLDSARLSSAATLSLGEDSGRGK